MNATFEIKHSKSKVMQEKDSNMSVHDTKQWPSGRNFLSASYTHVRFL